MENIYKIRIRTSPDPRDLYPSERRYSSSIVLGFSVLFFALTITSGLMGSLVVRKMVTSYNNTNEEAILSTTPLNSSEINEKMLRLINKIQKDIIIPTKLADNINIPAILSAGSFVMSLGCFIAGLMGLLAWKYWYIDQNITRFFLSSCFSMLTSSISLLIITLILLNSEYFTINDLDDGNCNNISIGLSVNIFITSLLGVIWSCLASKVSFNGVKNNYPEGTISSNSINNCQAQRKIEVRMVSKGNKIAKVVPPDILSHFPTSGKLSEYFPEKENKNLPVKAENNQEYEERMNKFLEGQS